VATAALAGFLRRLSRSVPPRGAATLAVCLVGDGEMKRLNATFRGVDATTDVLAFPGYSEPGPAGRTHLGDIAVSIPQADRQARVLGHSLSREIRILLLHGYLHLLGFDHETDDGEMMRLQRKLERRMLNLRSRKAS
jgi:probable rRNA maturation factor